MSENKAAYDPLHDAHLPFEDEGEVQPIEERKRPWKESFRSMFVRPDRRESDEPKTQVGIGDVFRAMLGQDTSAERVSKQQEKTSEDQILMDDDIGVPADEFNPPLRAEQVPDTKQEELQNSPSENQGILDLPSTEGEKIRQDLLNDLINDARKDELRKEVRKAKDDTPLMSAEKRKIADENVKKTGIIFEPGMTPEKMFNITPKGETRLARFLRFIGYGVPDIHVDKPVEVKKVLAPIEPPIQANEFVGLPQQMTDGMPIQLNDNDSRRKDGRPVSLR